MKKVVVVTGCSQGIGLDIVKRFINLGEAVYGISRNEFHFEGLNHVRCDVSDYEQCQKTIDYIFKKEGRIDILINNAGFGIAGSIEHTSIDKFQNIFDVNMSGLFFMTKLSLEHLRKTKGIIVNLGSIASRIAIPFQTFYSCTKAAVEIFSNSLRAEVRPYGVRVVTILPGDTKTNFTKNRKRDDNGIYQERFLKSISRMERDEQNGRSSDVIAKSIVIQCYKKRPKLSYTVGVEYKIVKFLVKILPQRWMEWAIYKMYAK